MSIFNFLYLPLKPTTNNAQPTTQNMSRDQQLKERWEQLVNILSNQFSQGEDLDLDAIIYLIGVQELGKVHNKFKKDESWRTIGIDERSYCQLLHRKTSYWIKNLEFRFQILDSRESIKSASSAFNKNV